MGRISFFYTVTLGILWEIVCAFVIIGIGLLIAFLTGYVR